jgi:hypothetical protein
MTAAGHLNPLAHVGEGVEVLVGARLGPSTTRSTRAPNLPNAVSATMATTRPYWRTGAMLNPTQAATVLLPIRVAEVGGHGP